MNKRIAEKSLGTVNVMNTEHPRIAVVERQQYGSQRPQWVVTVACNGIAEYHRKWDTRRDALEDFADLT